MYVNTSHNAVIQQEFRLRWYKQEAYVRKSNPIITQNQAKTPPQVLF